jgi:hypothetical protein
MAIIDIFHRGALAEAGLSEAGFEMAILFLSDLPVSHQAKALLERKGVDV